MSAHLHTGRAFLDAAGIYVTSIRNTDGVHRPCATFMLTFNPLSEPVNSLLS